MRILVAEDDPVIALGLAQRLRRLGHEPLGPEPDGLRAIARARQSDVDLYLFDIDMPELDGWRRRAGCRRSAWSGTR